QDHRAHADEAAIANGAAVQRDRMPYRNPIAHDDAVLVSHAVEHAAILHIGVIADTDGKHVAANNGVHPNAGVLAYLDIADDLGGFVDIAGLVNARRDSLVGTEHNLEKEEGIMRGRGRAMARGAESDRQSSCP